MNGEGRIIYTNGDVNEGVFIDGINDFVKGKITYQDGSVYEGELNSNHEWEGDGIFIGSKGEEYKGSWKSDLQEGKGEMKFENNEVYAG